MPFIPMDQILEQLPAGAVISRYYYSFEGDLRVIVRLPGEDFERRYTVDFEGGCPKIKEMP